MTSSKSRMATFLFALFLGCFGAHRFYVHKNGTGAIQLLLTCSVIGGIISGPWVFIDWVMILAGTFKDRDGRIITEW